MRIHLKWQTGVETKISNYVQNKKRTKRKTEKKDRVKGKTQTLIDKEGQVNISKVIRKLELEPLTKPGQSVAFHHVIKGVIFDS